MTRRLKRIAPMQAGKILGLLYACFGLLLLPFIAFGGLMGVFASHAGQLQNASAPPPAVIGAIMFGLAIGAPILYGLMGFWGASSWPRSTISLRAGSAVSRWK